MCEISLPNITVDKRTLRKRKNYLGKRASKNQLKNNFAMENTQSKKIKQKVKEFLKQII